MHRNCAGSCDVCMWSGFFRHSSFTSQIAHAVELVSAHDDETSQTPHENGHIFSVYPGLFEHSPPFAQPGQSSCVSLHAPLHTPHETGQFMFMKPGLLEHSPSLNQWLQSVWMSTHFGAQMPQLCGQICFMWSALSPVHSPSAPHAAQLRSLSLQKPTVADAEARNEARSSRSSMFIGGVV